MLFRSGRSIGWRVRRRICRRLGWGVRTAGLAYYAQKGIPTYTSKATDNISKRKGEKRAQFHFLSDTTFNWDGTFVEAFFPGHGHSPDNIVVWFENEGILHGGCLVKSVEATNLGNLEDADVKKWEGAILKLIDRYKSVKWVVPGHQEWSGKVALQLAYQCVLKK